MIEKIIAITDPSFRTGVNKNGSNYTMMKVNTDTHNDVTVFAPAQVGDEVILKYNEQYKNWNGTVATQQARAKAESESKLDEILETVRRIEKAIKIEPTEVEPNLDDIPFD